jgi:hypothetical protein
MEFRVAVRAGPIWELHRSRSSGFFHGTLRNTSGCVEVESWGRGNEGGSRTAKLYPKRSKSVDPELTPACR